MSDKEFTDIVKEEFCLKADVFESWKRAYIESMPKNDDVFGLVERLRKKCRLAVLSNTSMTLAEINGGNGVYSGFDPVILSCDVGMIKPDREIYDLTLQRVSLPPRDCVFIDDREENLVEPRDMGIHCICFEDHKQLGEELRRLGVKI